MAPSYLAKLAGYARVPTFCLCGAGERERARSLAYSPALRMVSSPRHAAVLVAVGAFPPELQAPARRVHDQLPTPSGVVHWAPSGEPPFPEAERVAAAKDPTSAIVAAFRRALAGEQQAPVFGPAKNPVDWQGKGPHGQGGKGMMGGTPYGRSMAMTGDDLRDGLALDRLSLELGPFLPWLPPGTRLSVTVQGDLIESLELRVPGLVKPDLAEVFLEGSRHPVRIADVEVARAKHHLAATADLLHFLGLFDLAARAYRLAISNAPTAATEVHALGRRLRRSLGLRLATRGVGVLPREALVATGSVARAAGRRDDVRLADPAYKRLGFEPLLREAGDVEARWQLRIAEAAQALELAQSAGDEQHDPAYPLEGPRGALGSTARSPLGDALVHFAPGSVWDEFVTTLVSLDLDPATLSPTEEEESSDDSDTTAHGGHESHADDGGDSSKHDHPGRRAPD